MFNSCFLQDIAYVRDIVAIKIDIVAASKELSRCRRGRQINTQYVYKAMKDLEEKMPRDLILISMYL